MLHIVHVRVGVRAGDDMRCFDGVNLSVCVREREVFSQVWRRWEIVSSL